MEEERKIEKLLRAYAKKRRADAGDPLKLHPAPRRQLQDEVARDCASRKDEDVSFRFGNCSASTGRFCRVRHDVFPICAASMFCRL